MKNTPEIITRQLNFAIRAQYLATRNPRALIDLFKTLLTARPWAERGSCSARGFFFFVFVSPDADLRG